MAETHALLSPSSSHRWLHCTPSARLAERFPNTGSDYAKAGTVAHAIGELKARKYFLGPMGPKAYSARLKQLKADPHYDKSMDNATEQYLDYLKSLALSFSAPPFVTLESRVDCSHIAPGSFGRADCIMMGDGRLCVIDYKNGAGVPVEAENNSQMMLYALGALQVWAPIYGDTLEEIHLAIVQPNAGGVKEWRLSRGALTRWGEDTVRPQAQLADRGEGEFRPGEWCRFCPAKSHCSARAEKLLALEEHKGGVPENRAVSGEKAPLLTDDEIGEVLSRAVDLEAWVKDLKEYALSALLKGRKISGWKAVEGRGSRDWQNQEEAFRVLQERGVAQALLWERKPASVAGLEKSLGKKAFAEAAQGLWEKSPGKPALVPQEDKRPPYQAAKAVFQPV